MASLTADPYATNVFGVQVQNLDYSDAGAPTTQSYHGFAITTASGKVIGRIQSFQNSGGYNREGKHVYELSNFTWGHPVDYVPGKITELKFAMARAEVWTQELEIALGYTDVFKDLTDQNKPFVIQEYLFKGNTIYRQWQYSGCWFTTKNVAAFEAEGDGIVKVESEVAYVSRSKIQ